MRSTLVPTLFTAVLALICAVDSRKLLVCLPSASTVATVDKATSEAIASTLALAQTEVVTCQGANEYSPDESQLSIALSLAISASSDAIEEECGEEDSVQAATEVVAEGVLKEINESIKEVDPEAQEIFQARSGGLLAELENELQARSLIEFEDSAEAKAELVAKRVIEAIQSVLRELRCGPEAVEPPPPPPTDVICYFIAGQYVGKDC